MSSAAAEPTLAELQAQLEMMNAERTELTLRIRRKELIEVARLQSGIVARAHQVRDLLMITHAREGATLAAHHRLEAGVTAATLTDMVRRVLTDIARAYRADHA